MLLTWPQSVRDQVAAWLAPEAKGAAKGNGVDQPIAAPTPPSRQAKALARQNSPFNVQTRLIAALKSNPNLSERAAANAAGVSRAKTAARLRQMEERGLVEKDATGRWKARQPVQGDQPDPPQPPAN